MSSESLKGMFKYYYDTLKHGSYVAVYPSEESKASIVKLQKRLGIKNPVAPEDLHVTIMYSKKGDPNVVPSDKVITAEPESLELFGDDKNCLVLTLESVEMDFRHEQLAQQGLVHSFEDYRPHVTLSYDYQGEEIDNEYLYDGKGDPVVILEFDREFIEPLKQ